MAHQAAKGGSFGVTLGERSPTQHCLGNQSYGCDKSQARRAERRNRLAKNSRVRSLIFVLAHLLCGPRLPQSTLSPSHRPSDITGHHQPCHRESEEHRKGKEEEESARQWLHPYYGTLSFARSSPAYSKEKSAYDRDLLAQNRHDLVL